MPETLAVLALFAIFASLAVPAFGNLLLENRMVAATNELLRGIHLAFTRAQAELTDVVLCRSTDGQQCAPAGDWGSGWIVFVNRDRDNPVRVDGGEPVLAVARPAAGLTISSNRAAFVLRPAPYRATNGTVVLCDRRGVAAARAVILGYNGHPRVSRRSASGSALTCPA